MDAFQAALRARLTMLSIETNLDTPEGVGQEALGDEDTVTQIRSDELIPALEKDIEAHAKTHEELESAGDAEVTLESLQGVLRNALRHGGLSSGELTTFAICQQAIARQVNVNLDTTTDLQSYCDLGAEQYTQLALVGSEKVKSSLWEKIKALGKKLVAYASRLLEKFLGVWARVGRAAKKLELRLSDPKYIHPSEEPITGRRIIEPLYKQGAHLSVNQIRQTIKATEAIQRLLSPLVADPQKYLKDDAFIETLMHKLHEGCSSLPDHSPQIIPKDAQEAKGFSRLKFWKQPEPISNLPKEIERLSYHECQEATTMIIALCSLLKRDTDKLGHEYMKQLKKNVEFNSSSPDATMQFLHSYPTIYSVYCRMNHWSARYALAVVDYIEASMTDQQEKKKFTMDEHGNKVEDPNPDNIRDVN